MKKLALIVVSLAFASTPVIACPHADGDSTETKTAEKAKDSKATEKKADSKKEADNAKTAKPATKPAGDAKKPAEKVSSK